jgi:hypothetical protein
VECCHEGRDYKFAVINFLNGCRSGRIAAFDGDIRMKIEIKAELGLTQVHLGRCSIKRARDFARLRDKSSLGLELARCLSQYHYSGAALVRLSGGYHGEVRL